MNKQSKHKAELGYYVLTPNIHPALIQAVQNVYPYVDAILIVLTRDQIPTKPQIDDPAKKIRYHFIPFTTFADVRNQAMKHLQSKWILAGDSDETFSVPLLTNLRAYIHSNMHDGYEFHLYHFYGTPDKAPDPFMHLRLFKYSSFKGYAGNVHERMMGFKNIKKIRSWKYVIYHYNQLSSMEQHNKWYETILKRELEVAAESGDKELINLALFRLWCNKNIDDVHNFNKPLKMKRLKREFKRRLRNVVDETGHYHRALIRLDRLMTSHAKNPSA